MQPEIFIRIIARWWTWVCLGARDYREQNLRRKMENKSWRGNASFARNNFMRVPAKSFGERWWKSSIKVTRRHGGKEMSSTSCKITRLWKSRKDAAFPRESHMLGCVSKECTYRALLRTERSPHNIRINPRNDVRERRCRIILPFRLFSIPFFLFSFILFSYGRVSDATWDGIISSCLEQSEINLN